MYFNTGGYISPLSINSYYRECHDKALGAEIDVISCPSEGTHSKWKNAQIAFAIAIFLKNYFKNNENYFLPIHIAKEYLIKDICNKLEVNTIEQAIYKCVKTFKETSNPISTIVEFDLLCRNTKDINAQDSDGNTAVNLSQQANSDYGDFMTPLLLDNGADCKIANKKQETPLHYATLRRDFQSAANLMKYGAEDSIQDENGQTPGDWAIGKNFQYWGPHLKFLKERNRTPIIKIKQFEESKF